MPIEQAVGPACRNREPDVRVVQRLLNGAVGAGLSEDGLFGPNTLRAISGYQASARQEPADGVLDPEAAELRALLARLPAGLSPSRLGCIMAVSPEHRIATYQPPLAAAMGEVEIDGPLRQAHFLAQIGHESGGLLWTEELASGEAYEGREDLGNTQPGDGPRFKGRGLIQLTGRANYQAFSQWLGVDLTRDREAAERLAEEPELSVRAATWFWARHGLNDLADRDDLRAVTRRINGGTNGIADRARYLRRAKAVLLAEPPG